MEVHEAGEQQALGWKASGELVGVCVWGGVLWKQHKMDSGKRSPFPTSSSPLVAARVHVLLQTSFSHCLPPHHTAPHRVGDPLGHALRDHGLHICQLLLAELLPKAQALELVQLLIAQRAVLPGLGVGWGLVVCVCMSGVGG